MAANDRVLTIDYTTGEPAPAAKASLDLRYARRAGVGASGDSLFSVQLTSDSAPRAAFTADGGLRFGSGSATADITLERYVGETGESYLSTDARALVGSVRFKKDPNAMVIFDTAGTNGRRLSIQPANQANSTASAQLEIIPGANVAPTEVTSQILLLHKTGANYERFVISCFNNEYQFHASRNGTGLARPTFFYVDNVLAWGVMTDATFRVYNTMSFGATGDTTLRRDGNGLRTNGGITIDKALIHSGTTVGFYGKTPVTQQVLTTAASAADIVTALTNLGLVKAA